jgi:hypothetical protein
MSKPNVKPKKKKNGKPPLVVASGLRAGGMSTNRNRRVLR